MKSILILAALTSALASANANLEARLLDPATMDPTRLSILSVIKTAMPTSPNTPMPTGEYEPEWYQKLPEDVKSLLPVLYPVAASEVSLSASASQTPEASETKTYTDATMVSFSPSASESPAPTSTSSSSGSSASASASASSSSAPWTSTETPQYAPSSTANAMTLYSGLVPNSTVPTSGPTSSTISPSATSTNFLSASARGTKALAMAAWVGVGAGLFLFA